MRDSVSVTTFTLLISVPIFSFLRRYSSYYFFRGSFIIESFINSLNIEQRWVVLKLHGTIKSNISHWVLGAIKLSRKLYLNPVMRLVGVLYVTPDHLHRYRKPTARNIAPRDFGAHRNYWSIWPMFTRGIDHTCGSGCEIDAFGLSGNTGYASRPLLPLIKSRGLCEINVQNFHNKPENVFFGLGFIATDSRRYSSDIVVAEGGSDRSVINVSRHASSAAKDYAHEAFRKLLASSRANSRSSCFDIRNRWFFNRIFFRASFYCINHQF